MMTNRHVCILGVGNMGRALISGLLRSGTRAEQLRAADSHPDARAQLAREFGVAASADALEAIEGAAIVVLAVKPQDAASLLASLAGALAAQNSLVVSVVAGVRIATLESACPGVPILRAMPNRPALIGAGISGAYAPPAVSLEQRQAVESVLRAVGELVWVESEAALDVVTALSGSGPAYFFLLAQLMAEAGERLGLSRATAQRLATVTLYGSALLVQSAADGDLARLRAEVTSPGGTTASALAVFDNRDLRTTVWQAMNAATQRSRELAASPGS
jgi:pyrroline-5-carboxylate reductase